LALKFRHLLEKHGTRKKIPGSVNGILEEKGIMTRGRTITGATFVEASSPAKNKEKNRDPETRSAKKGNPWRFEEKRAHRGGRTGLLCFCASATASALNSFE
jgi:IS5 family transposase